MSNHKYTTFICAVLTLVMIGATALFIMGESFGLVVVHREPLYVSSLFSTDKVHSLDIVVDEENWKEMLNNAQAEEYILCNVVIDGTVVNNVAIRPKGNSSLSSVVSSDSDRYSFKIEFDHYNDAQTYMGLDKLILNNLIQDNTYLKDYVSYQMMNAFDADAPLCSFIDITVNGEAWGLYLAVEGIEEAFAQRKYGSNYGELYKPDTVNEKVQMILPEREIMNSDSAPQTTNAGMPEKTTTQQLPQKSMSPQTSDDIELNPFQLPFTDVTQQPLKTEQSNSFQSTLPEGEEENSGRRLFQGGPMGTNSSDIALIYTNDEHDSYANIFNNSMFNPDSTDKSRLIASIKQLSEGTNLEEVIDIEEVLRYFVVHNYLLNFDSYTGTMLHNFYLYEKDGRISMIAWDYNLAFGAFSMGVQREASTVDSATALVNYPIDTPVSGDIMENRPLLNQLLTNETYLEQYHMLFSEFLQKYFHSGEFERMYRTAIALISDYVKKDPTAFCSYEEFTEAQTMLKEFCLLRAQSIEGQLSGTIESTSVLQESSNYSGFINASHIKLDVMGSAGKGLVLKQYGIKDETVRDVLFGTFPEEKTIENTMEISSNNIQPSTTEDRQPFQSGTSYFSENPPEQSNREASPLFEENQKNKAPKINYKYYWFFGGTCLMMAGGLIFALRFNKW